MQKRTICFAPWLFPILLVALFGCGGGSSRATAPPVTTPPPHGDPQAPTIQFTAQPTSIFLRGSSTLSWSTTNATSVTIDGLGPVAVSGSQVVNPAGSQTYTATATGSGGSAKATVTINVAPTASPIQHVVVLILQNISFDHLYGKFPPVNGSTIEGLGPGIPGFTLVDAAGKSVSPFLLTDTAPAALPEGHKAYLADLDKGAMDKFAFTEGDISMGFYDNTIPGIQTFWNYAQQFALADHFFASVNGEAPSNQLYMVAAADNNSPFSAEPHFGPCNSPGIVAPAYDFPHVGDQLTTSKINWAIFQENYGTCGAFSPLHDPFQFFVDTNNTPFIQDYSQFAGQIAAGTLPTVTFVSPGVGDDMHPGDGPISNGIKFTSNLVQQLQSSTLWPNTAIFITWDTGGGWYDHVPPPAVDAQGLGERVPFLVLSPFAKTGYVSHVVMDHVSILRFIQWNWGLPSLNDRNQKSGDVFDMFQFPPHP
jgi:phospholipase C